MAYRVAATKLSPERMSLLATARSIPGTLRQEVVIDRQHRFITDTQLARLEKVAGACPLRSIEAGIEFVETIERREGGPQHEPANMGAAS
jgi:hypothetical protein